MRLNPEDEPCIPKIEPVTGIFLSQAEAKS